MSSVGGGGGGGGGGAGVPGGNTTAGSTVSSRRSAPPALCVHVKSNETVAKASGGGVRGSVRGCSKVIPTAARGTDASITNASGGSSASLSPVCDTLSPRRGAWGKTTTMVSATGNGGESGEGGGERTLGEDTIDTTVERTCRDTLEGGVSVWGIGTKDSASRDKENGSDAEGIVVEDDDEGGFETLDFR